MTKSFLKGASMMCHFGRDVFSSQHKTTFDKLLPITHGQIDICLQTPRAEIGISCQYLQKCRTEHVTFENANTNFLPPRGKFFLDLLASGNLPEGDNVFSLAHERNANGNLIGGITSCNFVFMYASRSFSKVRFGFPSMTAMTICIIITSKRDRCGERDMRSHQTVEHHLHPIASTTMVTETARRRINLKDYPIKQRYVSTR